MTDRSRTYTVGAGTAHPEECDEPFVRRTAKVTVRGSIPTTPGQSAQQPRSRRPHGFWVYAGTFTLFLFAAGAPSSLYAVYGTRWHYSAATTTVVFGVYALVLLASLLAFGDLSDAIGRKPVVVLALGLLTVSLVHFALASGVGWLYGARVVQEIATGLLTASISAALIDTEPARRPGLTASCPRPQPWVARAPVSWSRQSWSSTRRISPA